MPYTLLGSSRRSTVIFCAAPSLAPSSAEASAGAASHAELKKRKATVEWSICSLTGTDRNGEPVRHSFGTAQFLLPREEKK